MNFVIYSAAFCTCLHFVLASKVHIAQCLPVTLTVQLVPVVTFANGGPHSPFLFSPQLPPKVKPSNSSQRLTRDQEKERPYLCTREPRPPPSSTIAPSNPITAHPDCGRRYKTSPSLKAHCTQYHAGEGAGPSLTPSPSHSSPAPAPPPAKLAEEKVPIQLPPPPNMVGRGCHKPNPYCDFCLGDDTGNRKSGKAERMVSCADCGRSGEWVWLVGGCGSDLVSGCGNSLVGGHGNSLVREHGNSIVGGYGSGLVSGWV